MDLGESSASFRICCLEFYFPRYSVTSPSPSLRIYPLSLPFPLRSFSSRSPASFLFSSFPTLSRLALSLPFRGSLCWASARFYPAFRDLASSLMDGSTILFHSLPLCALTSYRLSCSTPSPILYLFAHSMRDYAASEFTHSRKVRVQRAREMLAYNREGLTLHSPVQRLSPVR